MNKQLHTVQMLCSGNHRDLKIVPVIESSPLRKGFSQIGLFCFKNPLQVLVMHDKTNQ